MADNNPAVLLREPGQQADTFFFHIQDGYHYHKNRLMPNGVVYFKCARYEGTACKGRAKYSRGGYFVHMQPHTCGRDVLYPLEMRLRHKILEKCRRLEPISFRRIVNKARRRFPREVKARCTLKRMRAAMHRVQSSQFPRPPPTLRGLTRILQDPRYEVITLTEDGEDNLYAMSVDCGGEHGHAIIFATRRMMNEARRHRILFADGTKKSVPFQPAAMQIFILYGNWDHHILPFAWVLMERMTEEAYTAVLRVVRAMLNGAPLLERVITDFERALQNAFETVFPDATAQGCFFHLVRAQIYHAKHELVLAHALRNEPTRLLMRMCSALALLPAYEQYEDYPMRGLQLIMREARQIGLRTYRTLRPFFEYILTNWVAHPQRSQVMSVFGSRHRTNNTSESGMKALNAEVGVKGPNVYKFLGALKTLEDTAWSDLYSLTNLHINPSRHRKASSIANDRRIRTLNRQLLNPVGPVDDAILHFLRGAVHTFERMYEAAVEEL